MQSILRSALTLLFCAVGPVHAIGGQSSVTPHNPIQILSREAQASDSPAGLRSYSQHLSEMLLGTTLDPTYRSSFSERLANAEMLVRDGKRQLLTETRVVKAYNGLMVQMKAPASLRTNEANVRRMRAGLQANSPALTSYAKNPTSCEPTEAILLMSLLLVSSGRAPTPLTSSIAVESLPRMMAMPVSGPLANAMRAHYLNSHPEKDREKLFDRMAQLLDI